MTRVSGPPDDGTKPLNGYPVITALEEKKGAQLQAEG